MDVKKAVLLAGALIFAIITALMARSMFTGSDAPQVAASVMPAQPTGPFVLVATKALPLGTILDEGSFRFQPWPKDLVENAYFLKDKTDLSKLKGSVVRNTISAGQPLTLGGIIKPGERGFLAAALSPGMRAVTVPVSVQSSVAGFIFPGDRVDMMLTQTINGAEGDPLKVSETVLRNMRVLATDQRTNVMGEDGKPDVRTYANVTLEVTPRMAEKIAVAQTVGTLSLSLRSLADSTADLDVAIAAGNINLPKGENAAAEKMALATIAARPTDKGETFSTGADVSRFQRRSVPPKKAEDPNALSGSVKGGLVRKSAGPIVRVARGGNVTEVPVGGK
jgi:pilus assembly protein CpaB